MIVMSMNPFLERPMKLEDSFKDWKSIYPKPYNKNEVDPYTKTRIILMNGTEYEAVWFSHQFSRHCPDNDLRRAVAITRRIEQQQQKVISVLKPVDETILETTISYEQLAVDLTSELAKREPNKEVKMALDFALLEDFDHLYRYSDLLEMEQGIHAERLVGHYTEIMPGRPTISEHRFPADNIKKYVDFTTADPITKLNVAIITAAEQQTMNYYMNIAGFYQSDLGRSLYQEIGLIEEQHVTQYGSLLDTRLTWLENLLLHEYTECYLYYSCYEDETDAHIKQIWEQHFHEEIAHLHQAADLLKQYEKKEWQQVISNGCFPRLLTLGPNKEYVRDIIKATVQLTSIKEDYVDIGKVPQGADFFLFQESLNHDVHVVPSHKVIVEKINKDAQDYRYEIDEHPISSLRDKTSDNTWIGREAIE